MTNISPTTINTNESGIDVLTEEKYATMFRRAKVKMKVAFKKFCA